jgi:hypothetical protein
VNGLLVDSLDAVASYWRDNKAMDAGTFTGPTKMHCGHAMLAKDTMDRIADLVRQQPEAAAHLILYVLDQRGLTEHGGSVNGSWLSDRGKQVREIMRPFVDRDREELANYRKGAAA